MSHRNLPALLWRLAEWLNWRVKASCRRHRAVLGGWVYRELEDLPDRTRWRGVYDSGEMCEWFYETLRTCKITKELGQRDRP